MSRRPLSDLIMDIIFLICLVGIILVMVGFCFGAPAPMAKTERRPHKFVIAWEYLHYEAHFFPDGDYKCYSGGNLLYVGTWRFDYNGIMVEEKPVNSKGSTYPYHFPRKEAKSIRYLKME